jgi:hypothetical protein
MSILICSFFWIVLLLPEQTPAFTAPLGHFVLLFLVFLAFASHLHPGGELHVLPWLMRLIFVGGTVAVLGFVAVQHADRIQERLTPSAAELPSWPLLLGVMAAGFAVGLTLRYLLGRDSEIFQTIRGWLGVVAMLVLLAETVYQFVIRPALTNPPTPETLQVWEAVIIGFVSSYFGTRA